MNTQEHGLCRDDDPEKWFPDLKGQNRKKRRLVPEAVVICQRCPIQEPCAQYALENDMRFGVWGGLTEKEREKINHPNGRKRSRAQDSGAKESRARVQPPSPVRGVSWHAYKGRWVVVIVVGQKKHWVGRFTGQAEAEAAALRKHAELGTNPVRYQVA